MWHTLDVSTSSTSLDLLHLFQILYYHHVCPRRLLRLCVGTRSPQCRLVLDTYCCCIQSDAVYISTVLTRSNSTGSPAQTSSRSFILPLVTARLLSPQAPHFFPDQADLKPSDPGPSLKLTTLSPVDCLRLFQAFGQSPTLLSLPRNIWRRVSSTLCRLPIPRL